MSDLEQLQIDRENFVENFSAAEWFKAIFHVRDERRKGNDMGITAVVVRDWPCEGGYCKRHGHVRKAEYVTNRADLFCADCAIIWATKVFLECKVQWPD